MPEIYQLTHIDQTTNIGAHGSLGVEQSINRNFDIGAEAGFGYYGQHFWVAENPNDPFDDVTGTSTLGFDTAAVLSYQASPCFSIRARLGAALMLTQISFSGADVNEVNTENHRSYNAAPLFGVGMSYKLNHKVKLAFDYTHISGRTYYREEGGAAIALTKHPEFNTFQLGIEYLLS